ncbi:MAG: protein-glutamate O-methyltransferase CheR [Deltaproteobacteria bacterium]|nr:protein-glutamate O-methyltransferase CheR [Deltaproteobacteria bacterium]
MTADELRLLSELIYDHCGILVREDLRFLLERRLWARMRALDLPDFLTYYRYLRFDPGRRAELEAAVEALTTNETYFFREPHQLKAFREELLPLRVNERARVRRLRLWSAGCSTGEEAYTLAMLVLESGLFGGWEIEVFGSDISRKVLAAARKGVYSRNALRETPPQMVERYFTADAGRWAVKDEARSLVSFGHLNLIDEHMVAMLARFDVVFCRNVMIYLDLPARRRVLKSFHGRLWPGGYLLLGHSESLIHVTADYELVHLKNDLVYRKPLLAI